LLIARAVQFVATVIVTIIALAIVLIVLDANATNTIVSHVRDWASTLVGPFKDMFHLHSAKGTIAVNYGLAIVAYTVIARLIVSLVAAIFAPAARRAAV
jgi:hypothetical protein